MKSKLLIIFIGIASIAAINLKGANPMATNFSYDQCQGSAMPYPKHVERVAYPDTLQPVMINYVGRHGSRYPASSANCKKLQDFLLAADAMNQLTPLGNSLLKTVEEIMRLSQNRWGSLDSLGESEMRFIASRMYQNYKPLLERGNIKALSSYSPRAMMSMYFFTHQLDRLNNNMEFLTTTGRENDALLRPFDIDADYLDFRKGEAVKDAYKKYFDEYCITSAIERVVKPDFEWESAEQKQDMGATEYNVLAGCQAMSLDCSLKDYFTLPEINALWGCYNFRQYIQRTASTLSAVPAEIAIALLLNIIEDMQACVDNASSYNAVLRFGHAETLMPLLSLMRLPGCYYLTNYYDTVAQHWQDFNVVPMAANLQLVLFVSGSGKYYLRIDLNEKPVAFIPNSSEIYVPWSTALDFLKRCIPMHAQPW